MNMPVPLANPTGPEFRPEWSTSLVMDVALGTSRESILEVHDLVEHQLDEILVNPVFVMAVGNLRKSLEKDGATFKLKAQLQAEFYLTTAHDMIMDKTVDDRVRMRLIEDMVRWGGFDAPAQVNGTGGGFSISINFNAPEKRGIMIDGDN